MRRSWRRRMGEKELKRTNKMKRRRKMEGVRRMQTKKMKRKSS